MDVPSIFQIITTIIAVASIVIAYLGFRDKKTDKTDRDLQDRIKATVLSDAVSVKAEALSAAVSAKAAILSDAVNAKAVEIKELQKQSNDTDNQLSIVSEKLVVFIKDIDLQLEKLHDATKTNEESIQDLNITMSIITERVSNITSILSKVNEKLDSLLEK